MPTQNAAAILVAAADLAAATTAKVTGRATLPIGATFGGLPASLFGLLQNFLDAEEDDPARRGQAIASLVAVAAAATASVEASSTASGVNRAQSG
jgi:hypothetical protein